MGSSGNLGGQRITWKYKTPLIASQLSTTLGHISSAGLCAIEGQCNDSILTISKGLSLIVKSDKNDQALIVGGSDESMFRIVTTETVVFNGIGTYPYDTERLILLFKYTFSNAGELTDSWFGEFTLYSENDFGRMIKENKIAENQYIIGALIRKDNGQYMFTSSCADWSDLILREGRTLNGAKNIYPTERWISVSSPRRHVVEVGVGENKHYVNDFTKYIEVRTHNELNNSSLFINQRVKEPFTYQVRETIQPKEEGEMPTTVEYTIKNHELKLIKDDGVLENSYFVYYDEEGKLSVSTAKNERGEFTVNGNIFPLGIIEQSSENSDMLVKANIHMNLTSFSKGDSHGQMWTSTAYYETNSLVYVIDEPTKSIHWFYAKKESIGQNPTVIGSAYWQPTNNLYIVKDMNTFISSTKDDSVFYAVLDD